MTTDYALDSHNNMFIGTDNSIKRVSDGAQVTQHVRSRLLFYLGESPIDKSQGVPYFEIIFVKPANLPQVESILKTIILQTEGIQELTSFGLDFDSTSRKLTVTWDALTTFGDVIGATLNV